MGSAYTFVMRVGPALAVGVDINLNDIAVYCQTIEAIQKGVTYNQVLNPTPGLLSTTRRL